MIEDFFDRHLAGSGVLVILRGFGPDRTVELCQRAWRLGVELVEIPIQSDDDLAALERAAAEGRRTGRIVGAGTVTTPRLVAEAAGAGARFTVAPGLDPEVAVASVDRGLPHLPGVATASEVHHAARLGIRWQKMFPAAQLGADWIAAMHGPFPHVRFVATGGIDPAGAAAFRRRGAAAVALGSSFADAADDAITALLKT